MKRRTKLVIVGVSISLVVAAMVVMSAPITPPFADSIPRLKGRRPAGESTQMTSYRVRGHGMLHRKTRVSTYIIPGSFSEVSEQFKRELKPRSNSASSFPSKKPSVFTYGFMVKGNPGGAVVSVMPEGDNTTRLQLFEQLELSPVDRAKLWYQDHFGRSSGKATPTEAVIVAPAKSSGRPVQPSGSTRP